MKVKVIKRNKKTAPAYYRKSIFIFNDTYNVLENCMPGNEFNALPESLREYLRFFESFEPFVYLVQDNGNGDMVTIFDSVSGDIYVENIPIEKFIADSIEYARENMEEDN